MYDFAVVGLGPPGAHFARRAAADGYSVVGFERGEVGQPLACSGHVSRDIWQFVPGDARDDLLQNEIYGARFRLGGPDAKPYPFYKHSPVSNVIDRIRLDRVLAEEAAEVGAEIRENATVTGVEENPESVTLSVMERGSSKRVEARMVVGADGPRSTVRRDLGLPEPDEFLQGLLVHTHESDHDDFVDVHLTVPTFFAWRIPRGDAGVEYGIGAPPEEDAMGRLQELTNEYGVEAAARFAGRIPIGPPERTVSERGFLLGDAAAQTKPFTGGGILYGLRAATLAAEVVDPADPGSLKRYETGWRDELAREIRLGSAIRRAYSLPRSIQRSGLWSLSGEIGVHMDEPSSVLSTEQLRALFR
ncbi:MAG: geranylgeranyl reductase family protein [Halodesulfurarchaeum sp.]